MALRVYLAPHHDDILLSLPARLLAERNRSDRRIVVVFSDESPEMGTICARLHAELGIEVDTMGFREAIHRGVSVRACLRPARMLRDIYGESAHLDGIIENFTRLFARVRPTELVVPLLSVHIDHALLRAAAERLTCSGSQWRILYYEDQPYAALWPQLCAREVALFRRLEDSNESVPVKEVESLLQKTRALVQGRDLARILRYHEPLMLNGVEPLWSDDRHGHKDITLIS